MLPPPTSLKDVSMPHDLISVQEVIKNVSLVYITFFVAHCTSYIKNVYLQ